MNILAQLAENAIRDAQERGEFENLRGTGKPLSIESDPFMPEHLKMAYKVLKNSGFLPPEILMQREIRSLIECLDHETDESRKVRQIQKLNLMIAKAKLNHSGLLLEENEEYFRKVVAKISLNNS